MRRCWTFEEIEILKARYPRDSTRAIADDLERTVSAIEVRANKMGLKKVDLFWTPEQRKKFRELYPHTPNKELTKIFGRTLYAIQHRADVEGLYKKPEDRNGKTEWPQDICRVSIPGWGCVV